MGDAWPLAVKRRTSGSVTGRRRFREWMGRGRAAEAGERRFPERIGAGELETAFEAFDEAVVLLDGDMAKLMAGEGALARCAMALGSGTDDAGEVLRVLADQSEAASAALAALKESGRGFDLRGLGPDGSVAVRGRAIGAMGVVRLSLDTFPETRANAEGALAALVNALPDPALLLTADGALSLANAAWLTSVGALTLVAARDLPTDRFILDLAAEARLAGVARGRVRWTGSGTARRAHRVVAAPLPGGETMAWTWDVTGAERAHDTLLQLDAAEALILGAVSDAVGIFDDEKRLTQHNSAFANLWGLEPAWLASRPSHGALLDRLRQADRLPETPDYGRFKADELARHQRVEPSPEAIWRIGSDRILKVLSLPHPAGGLVMIFSDITPEVRLKSQFNHLIQVQQATLDRLTDAVAVFGPDAHLKLFNDAFTRLWEIPAALLEGRPHFDSVVDRCVAKLHDLNFWAGLKGRITDPDPGVRAAAQGEAAAADGRRLAWQSRPLPDGATLVSFADVTDARRLERALADRETALETAERLKRDFVGSVSYELRTPLTTILGYAELLQTHGDALSERARGWVTAVRSAAVDLARSVEDILAFAEIDAGEMALRLSPTNLHALLQGATDRWRDAARDAGVNLGVSTGDGAGAVLADEAHLSRVMDHLVEHALRQTPAGGSVTLAARRAHGEVCIEVTDTGRGIPFHVQAHIFDRFNGEETAGAGLGLALVKALVELHGGWVAVESEPGAGATFACHLPDGGPNDDPGRATDA